MNPVTKDNVRRRLRAVEGEVAHLRTQVEQAYDGRNKMLSEKVIAPAMADMQQMVVASRSEITALIDARMKDVWEALSGLTKVVTTLTDRMDAVDKTVAEIESDIADLEQETESHETRLDEIEASDEKPETPQ